MAMKRARMAVLLLVLLPFSACSEETYTPTPLPPPPAVVQTFREDAMALMRRPELDVDVVTIQYIMIATGVTGVTNDKPDLPLAEAETRAAELYLEAKTTSDFDKMVYTHSYGRLVQGQRPGMFTLHREDPPTALGPTSYKRTIEAESVWKAAWRLQPGEVGPVERHLTASTDGHYIIRRLTDAELATDNPANFEPPNEQVKAMREAAAELLARPEHSAEKVRVRHLLIARYMSSDNGEHPILKPAGAEIKAAEVFAEALQAEDFEALVRKYTYDKVGDSDVGAYSMVTKPADGDWKSTPRDGMIPHFGDAGWRLEVGEVSVILYDRAGSWYGYHIIQRLE